MINSTIRSYNKKSDLYCEEVSDFWKNFPLSIIDIYVSKLPGKKILNVGSGPGLDALILRNYGLDVTCLDASSEMIRKTKNLGFKSIKNDFKKMNFQKNSFDGVWAFTSLLHVSKVEAENALEKIHKFLKPNGLFLIGMIEGEFEGTLEREGWQGTDRFFRFYSESELTKMSESKGFKKLFEERYKPRSKTYLSQVYIKI